MIAVIAAAPKRKLMRAAGVSDHTIDTAIGGGASDSELVDLYEITLAIADKGQEEAAKAAEALAWLKAQAAIEGKKALAVRLKISYSYLVKLLGRQRDQSASFIKRVASWTRKEA